jgi:Fe-coproporphyrin III synthase
MMCNIWRMATATGAGDAAHELLPQAYRRLPASLRDINITGGEPFLREDLAEVIGVVHETCPRARIIISTNGLLTKRIREVMRELSKKIPGIGIAVSIDGIGEMHDRMRGMDGAFAKARQTLDMLRQENVRNVRIAFTATAENIEHLSQVYDLSRELGVEFTCATAHASEHYFHTEGSEAISPRAMTQQANYVIGRELAGFTPKRWARAYFMEHMARFNIGLGRPFWCRAGQEMFFVGPEGSIYPCNVLSMNMGNIEDGDFAETWESPEAEEARKRARHCNGCWMICSARTAMRRHWWRVLTWCVKRKLTARGRERRGNAERAT